ncbi:putative phage abortive infection protein [Algibacter luteus]|uniref:putative phage abortive infection protein n=1 Tax=Algibacter luteus TaxID=1178825 RepID=UPI0011608D9D|nr:putative phage abortive infection protein [Algibacter luteus]
MKKTLTEKNSKLLLWIGLILFIAGIGVFFYKESILLDSKVNAEKIAQFGDFIGGIVGSLWSLAGVILFYVALTEQRKDIEINRETLKAQLSALNQQIEEFELQRTELAETRKVFEEQSETLKIQRFENTFFQLLTLHHELVDKLNFSKVSMMMNVSMEKREVLSKAFEDLEIKLRHSNSISEKTSTGAINYKVENPNTKEIAIKRLNKAYKEFYFDDYKQILSHYFRNVYHIFKFIYKSQLIKKSKKQFYATLVRAQLSSDELFLILYNSLHQGLGYPNFLFLIKEFDIMQNFDFRIIAKYPYHQEIYDDKINSVKQKF